MHWSWLAEFDKRPADWQVAKLGGLIEIVAGQSPEGSSVTQSGEGLPFLQGNAEFTETSPKAVFWCNTARKRCLANDTLISVRAPVGEMNRADQAYGLGRGLAALRAKTIDPDFLFYGMQLWRKAFGRVAQGTTFDAISERHFRQMWVCFPREDAEQRAIADGFALVDNSIAAVRESIAKAERLQKGLMQKLLTGRVKPDGTPRNKDEFQETKLGLLPKDWSVARVKDFGEVSTGKTPPTADETNFGGDFQFITPGDMGGTKWIKKSERSLSALGSDHAGVLPANTVCVVCIGATIGKIGITIRPACTNQQINSVTCSDKHSPEYLYYSLRHHSQHLLAIAGVNATPQLNKSDFSKYRLPMPATPDEEKAIGAKLAVFDDLIEAKQTKILALQRLKKSLMQNLLTGRIRLPVESTAKKGT